MRLAADFSLFDIRLAGGVVGTVYVGEHADISDAPPFATKWSSVMTRRSPAYFCLAPMVGSGRSTSKHPPLNSK